MAMATATHSSVTSSMESSQTLIQTESRVQRSYQEVQVSEQRQVKKKKSMRRHKDEGTISVSKSSSKLHKKMLAADENPQCVACSRPVYAMERIKAEKRAWHKECFRCTQCNKQLTVETYQSDHTTLYCKPHFKQLFEPKPVDGDDQPDAALPKKHQMIICESNPVELPPDVARASDKPDLGLKELSQLDVKSRFEVFEKKGVAEEPAPLEPRAPREKSTALLSKLAKFKAKGMDVGVSDEYLNGVPVEASSSEPEDEEDEDSVLRKSYKHTNNREQPVSFCNMSEIVGKFETGQHSTSERTRERKQEIQNIRSRLFMGKQAKIKEMYEQSVMQSEQGVTSADKISRELELDSEKSRAIKQRFENGEVFNDENQPPKNRDIEDRELFNGGIGKQSRSIFLELDANAKNMSPTSPPPQEVPKRKEIPFIPKDVVRAADKVEEVQIQTADITDRFKFFETYKPEQTRKEFRMTPPRQTQRPKSPSPELYHEPSVVRSEQPAPDTGLAATRHTASRMINVFRQLEEQRQPEHQGPKPLKCFTPPPPGEDAHHGNSSEEEYSDEEYSEDSEDERQRFYNEARERDEALKQAQKLARTTSFRDRFEHWSESEPERRAAAAGAAGAGAAGAGAAGAGGAGGAGAGDIERDDDGESQLETAKSLREKFEAMKVQSNVTKNFAPKVNRFVATPGIGKQSRSIFLELDANAKNMSPTSPPPQEVPKRKEIPFIPKDVVRAADKVEEVQIQTADITDRFKFFETYKPEQTRKEFRMTPPRQTQRPKSPSPELYHEPSVVRSEQPAPDTGLAATRHTASRMINVFRQLEEQRQPEHQGPKPLKCFTPPPPGEDAHHGNSSEEEYSDEEYSEDSEDERQRFYNEARERDEALKQAQKLARTTSFRDRFEHWSESEPERRAAAAGAAGAGAAGAGAAGAGGAGGAGAGDIERDDDGESQLETAKSLREKFEAMKVQSNVTKNFAPKVNRFV